MRVQSTVAATLLLVSGGAALADTPATAPVTGTRLAISAEGEVARAPDLATLNAGVVTQSSSAADAMAQNARRMAAVVAALHRAGVADKDIRTSALSLQPQYRTGDDRPPTITGYEATDQLNIRFHDIARTGAILDALVGQGVNQIGGPDFAVEHPDAALDEARAQAVTRARARAEVYAKAAGMSVRRIVSIDEAGGYAPMQAPRPFMMARAEKVATDLQPGEEKIGVTLQMTFELQ